MNFNKLITLYSIKEGKGHNQNSEITDEKVVWACVQLPSTTLKIIAIDARVKVDMIIHMWRREYSENYTHVKIDNLMYRINITGSSINELMIKLTISRS